MIYLNLIIATTLPLIILYFMYRLNLYATQSYAWVLACFVWGVISFGVALFLGNWLVFEVGWVNQQTLSHDIAPVTEEMLKALFLIALVRRSQFTYFVDGAVYGFAIGIGFAIMENALYLSTNPDLSLALGRVISTNLMHATATSIVGIALGQARFHPLWGRFLWSLLGVLVAMAIHTGFNHLVTQVNGRFLFLYAAFCGFSGLSLIILIIKRGLAEQKQWIEEKLGAADRVTVGETAVVQRLANVYDILTPLAAQFGPEKAQTIEDFLILQARLGILRKTLDKMKDDKMRLGIESQIATLSQEMDDARRAVGPYCMVYLRNIFPEHNSPLWQLLENKIQTRPPTSQVNNIWTTLTERTQRVNPK